MDGRLLTKIALRILAVYLVGLGFWLVPDYFMAISSSIPPNTFSADTPFYLEIFFNPMVYGVIIWFLAPHLAKLAVGGEATETAAAADPAAWQTAGLTVLGVYFIVQYAPVILGLAIECFGNGPGAQTWMDGERTSLANHLTVAGARLLLGIVLVLGASYFTRLVRRLRIAGELKE